MTSSPSSEGIAALRRVVTGFHDDERKALESRIEESKASKKASDERVRRGCLEAELALLQCLQKASAFNTCFSEQAVFAACRRALKVCDGVM